MKRCIWIILLLLTGCTEFWRGTWFGPSGEPVYPAGPTAPGQYRVEAGETLYSIAFRKQMDFRLLAEWNGIGGDYLIKPGQILRLTEPPGGVRPRVEETPSEGIRTYPTREPPPRMDPAPEVRASLKWQWPVQGDVLRGFAEKSGSKGMDIRAELGAAVLSAAPGRVVYSGSGLRGYGELVIIKHDDVYLSAYGYNRSRLVKEGDKVRAGQLIAEVGTGPEQKPMLHFEVRERGKPINPEKLLPRR
ncbi:MAG: peptidoglycan DD-metalloendopeptidase family protein [Pseudomonadota bacterium]